jgi:nucleolin
MRTFLLVAAAALPSAAAFHFTAPRAFHRTIVKSDLEDSMEAPSEPDFAAAATDGASPDFAAAAAASQEQPRLYVGNLNFRTDDQELFEIFSEFGTVTDAHHVNDRFDPDRKRGFGFVTMETQDAANAAVEALNGVDVGGRNIRVDFAAPQGERPPRTERTERPQRERRPRVDDTGRRVYVGNLDYGTSDDTLSEIFSEFGDIEYCAHLSEREDPSRKRGFGFITFSEKSSAEAAVDNLDGLEVDGRSIRVNIAQPKY